jgi:TonB family protein
MRWVGASILLLAACAASSANDAGRRYLEAIYRCIRAGYEAPGDLPGQSRRAVVMAFIGSGGEVERAVLESTSGSSEFDSAVLSAVKQCSGLDPPPEQLRELLRLRGVEVEFAP